MDKSCAAESPKAWWHSVKLHKCIWRDISVLVLILIRNKNPISKSIKNYFDLGNLGIIANVKSLVSNSQVPIHPFLILSPLVHSTNLICFSGKAPNVRNERTQPPDHHHPCGFAQPLGLVTTSLGVSMGNQKWMKKHFSKATIICPQKLWKTVI